MRIAGLEFFNAVPSASVASVMASFTGSATKFLLERRRRPLRGLATIVESAALGLRVSPQGTSASSTAVRRNKSLCSLLLGSAQLVARIKSKKPPCFRHVGRPPRVPSPTDLGPSLSGGDVTFLVGEGDCRLHLYPPSSYFNPVSDGGAG